MCAVGNLFPNFQQLYELPRNLLRALTGQGTSGFYNKNSAPLSFKKVYRMQPDPSRWTVPLKALSTCDRDRNPEKHKVGRLSTLCTAQARSRQYCTLIKKENKIFLIYQEIQSGAVAKSYMTNGLLIYGEIFAHQGYSVTVPPPQSFSFKQQTIRGSCQDELPLLAYAQFYNAKMGIISGKGKEKATPYRRKRARRSPRLSAYCSVCVTADGSWMAGGDGSVTVYE